MLEEVKQIILASNLNQTAFSHLLLVNLCVYAWCPLRQLVVLLVRQMYYLVQLMLHRSEPATVAAAKFYPPIAASTFLSWRIPTCLLHLFPTSSAEQCSCLCPHSDLDHWSFYLPALFVSCIIFPSSCTLWLHKEIFPEQKGRKCLEGCMTKSSGSSQQRCRDAVVKSLGFCFPSFFPFHSEHACSLPEGVLLCLL